MVNYGQVEISLVAALRILMYVGDHFVGNNVEGKACLQCHILIFWDMIDAVFSYKL